MTAHLWYLTYVLRHKWFVFRAGLALGVPLWQLLIHDWTKFTPAEWGPYVRRFGVGNNSKWESDADPQEWKDAWAHHWQHNPHHWEYWRETIDDTRFGTLSISLPMPERYAREMVADWYGAGMAQGKPDIAGWYRANRAKRTLHPDTEAFVEQLLKELTQWQLRK
jgi:hypothetical protein